MRTRSRLASEQEPIFPFDPLRDVPFVVACVVCDCESPDSYQEAVVAGWTHICYAPGGFSANFYGYCPEHRLTELERLPESLSHHRSQDYPP